MGYRKPAVEDIILRNCPSGPDEVMPWKKAHLPFVSDMVSGISHGLKHASCFRMRLQKEIQDILERQSLNVHAGAPSAGGKEDEA